MILISRLIGISGWIVAASVALAAAAQGQEPAPALRADYQFPATARPISVEQPPSTPPSSHVEQRFPVRLVTAESPPTIAAARPPLKLAPRSAAGKESMAKPIAPNPANAIGTVVASLGIVLGLFLMLVWCSRRFAPAGTALLPKEALELLGRAALVGKHQAQLVRVGNKLLVVALSPAGATTLTEITEPAEIERLTAICRGGKPGSSTAAFRQVLDQMAQEPASGGFVGVATSNRRGGR